MDFSQRATMGAGMLEKTVQRLLAKTGLDSHVSKAMTVIEKYIPQPPAAKRSEEQRVSDASPDVFSGVSQSPSHFAHTSPQSSLVTNDSQPQSQSPDARIDDAHIPPSQVDHQYSVNTSMESSSSVQQSEQSTLQSTPTSVQAPSQSTVQASIQPGSQPVVQAPMPPTPPQVS